MGTIDGKKAKIKIPDGTQDGKQFRLKGKGMPFMRRGDFGDLYVQAKTEVPVYLNKEQKELLERFRKIENEKSNPRIKNDPRTNSSSYFFNSRFNSNSSRFFKIKFSIK